MKLIAAIIRLFRGSPATPMPFCLTEEEQHDYELLQLERDLAWERARLKAQSENLQFNHGAHA